jgi:predicted transcriptional regulator of viral defense system
MSDALEYIFHRYPRPFLTDIELYSLLEGTPNSRYSRVKRLLAQGRLLHIRRGLYGLTDKIGFFIKKPHPFELAQYIYGPSYISLESALSFHGLIPEAVYEITSVCMKRSQQFNTPLGIFSYSTLPSNDFFFDVERIEENNYQFFIAKPWKAICDYIYCYKKNWKDLQPLIKGLRINTENLPILGWEEMELLIEFYHHQRISRFLKNIRREEI